ncbi:enoyl-CoA hydratase/isomerase family protein [Thermodesulfobacteriota bacterium]
METIALEKRTDERVGIMTLNYKGENRFHPDLIEEMMQTLDEVEHNGEIGALVITGGDPKFFSNGLDLEWIMAHITEPESIADYLRLVNAMFKRWTLFPKPTVAALNGHTFAAGLFMAAHMDFRLMREDRGWVCLPEVDINIPLLPGMIAICQAVMPPQGFRQLYYTGKRFTGPEAVGLGFVDAVYPLDDLLPESVSFAAELAKKRTRTYAEMKRRIRADVAHLLDEVDPKYFMETLTFSIPE